jgi:hypothetical protein
MRTERATLERSAWMKSLCRPAAAALVLVISAWLPGSAGDAHGSRQGSSGSPAPFLNQTREVPPRREWNREVTTRTGGTIRFKVTAHGPFGVTLVTGKGYEALRSGDPAGFSKRDVLLTLDAPGPTYEGRVTLPPGSSWFIIENQTDVQVRITLECYAVL